MVIYHHFVFHYGAKFRDKSAMFGSESASTHEEEKNIICKPTITVRCITTSQIQSHYRVRECRLWSFALMITCKLHSQHKTFTYLYQNWIFVWDREIRLFYADLYSKSNGRILEWWKKSDCFTLISIIKQSGRILERGSTVIQDYTLFIKLPITNRRSICSRQPRMGFGRKTQMGHPPDNQLPCRYFTELNK